MSPTKATEGITSFDFLSFSIIEKKVYYNKKMRYKKQKLNYRNVFAK